MKGFYWALATTVLWGIAPIFEKMAIDRTSPLLLLTVRAVLLASVLLTITLVSGKGHQLLALDGSTILLIALGALFGALLGLYTYFTALKLGEASRVIPIAASYLLVTTILAILFLGEKITVSKIIGAALIVGGILLLR